MTKTTTKAVCLCLGFMGFSLGIWAQSSKSMEELKPLKIQENRLEMGFAESSRDIQVITREEIQRLPVQSLNELLSWVGGVDIRQRGPFGTQADLSMDGGTSEQTLILLNGVKLIDDQTAHNMMNIPVPLSAIDHIEILRGPAARVYGINALTGAINIVTIKENTPFVSGRVFVGSSFQKKEADDGSGIYGGGGLDVAGNFGNEHQSHLLALGQSLYNGQRYNTAEKNTRLFYNGNYNFNPQNQIDLIAGYVHNRFGANGFYAAPGDKNSEEIVNTAVFSLSSKHKIGAFTFQPRISDRLNKDDYRYFKDDLNTARSVHHSNALSLEANGNLKTDIGTFGLGWESRLTRINSTNIGKHNRNNHGAYAEYKKEFWGKLRTNLGVYLNYNTDFGWQAFPGIDLAYDVSSHWTLLANIGSGERIPSFTDLYLDQRPGNIGNPEIQPEDGWQSAFNIRFHQKQTQIQVGYFYRNIRNFVDWVRDDDSQPYSPINFGNNKVHGISIYGKQKLIDRPQKKLNIQLSYNYLHPSYKTNGDNDSKYVLESLKHQFIVGVYYQMHQFSVQVQNRLLQRELNKAYDVMDLQFTYAFQNIALYADVSNLWNTDYREAGAVPMPKRWFLLGVKLDWNK